MKPRPLTPSVIGMQHRKAEQRVGEQQARGEHAADEADQIGQERAGDRDREHGRGEWRKRHLRDLRPRPLQPARDAHDQRGEPEIEQAGQRSSAVAFIGGTISTRMSSSRSGSLTLGSCSGAVGRRAGQEAQGALELAPQSGLHLRGVEPVAQHRDDDDAAPPMIAVHTTMRPTGYHSMLARIGAGDRAREQRQIADPPGRQADAEQEGERDRAAEHEREAARRRPAPR